jgi:lycopene cyclase domain-containing protein|tara:strand:- start:9013 stop:9600 length:588 start_codon:yes stop_codon:yes gene_type:complete
MIPFIAWDVYFTNIGVWGFNPDHLIGVNILNLPLEECLFFLCIPYASIFTYHCFGVLIKKDIFAKYTNVISLILVVLMVVASIVHFDKLYTTSTFIALALAITIFQWGLKVKWLSRFYFSYLVLLLPFYITNGMLTGMWLNEPVVIYNDLENLNIRWNTIPIEDVFYGMLLILINIGLYEYLQSKQQKTSTHISV